LPARIIDLETVCNGPSERDLVHLDAAFDERAEHAVLLVKLLTNAHT
jgi:hypothetical protein